MAYKFQLGAAKLAGAVEVVGEVKGTSVDAQEGNISNVGALTADSIGKDDGASELGLADDMRAATNKQIQFRDAGQKIFSPAANQLSIEANSSVSIDLNASNKIQINSSAAVFKQRIELSGSEKLRYGENMDAGKFLVSNGTDYASVALSGDASLASTGALTISGLAVTPGKMANLASANILVGDESQRPTARALSGDATMDAAGEVTIADEAVTYSKMQHVSATARILGRNSANAGDVEEVTPAQLMGMFNSDLGGNFTIGNQSDDLATFAGGLVVGGDLVVQGTTVTLDVATVGITGSFSFEGSTADEFETTLSVVDPTADRALDLPNIDGNLGAFSHSSWRTARSTVTVGELDLLGAGAGSSVAIQGADGMLMFDATDSNATKKVLMSDIADFIGEAGRLLPGASTIIASDVTISNEISLVDTSAARTLTMPDITDAILGRVFVIKDAAGNGASVNAITVEDSAAGHSIDGETSLTLESDSVAISLVACKNGTTYFYAVY